MTKVAGSYESVVRGVSEQVAQDRRSGQHYEQVNMIADPVRGLARRHGSVMQDEVILTPYNAPTYAALLADTKTHAVYPFFVDGVEHDLIYRTGSSTLGQQGFAFAFNKQTSKFIPVVLASGDATLNLLVSGGVSAITGVGKYLFLAGNSIVPSFEATNSWDNPTNRRRAAVWVRGGAYSRTFKITVTKADGSQIVVSYKTVSSSYPGLLDTSDIPVNFPGTPPVPNENYQKAVNDRTNAYNSEVTKWIGTAAADITPENIAQKLVDQLATYGLVVARAEGTVIFDEPSMVEVSADDGGDGTLIRAVGSEIVAADLVSTIHHPGKVVKVRPKSSKGDDAYYLVAQAKPETDTPAEWGTVSWRETAGYKMQPADVLVLGTVQGGTLYLASSAAGMAALAGGAHPAFKANAVGDDISCALPYFFGKTINYLGVFQDRLVIGSGSTLLMSRPGDYFNWFRQSVLTVLDTDPWEGYALGAEDDTIRHSTAYDRNLVLYGERFQYQISGRQTFTPKTGSIVTASAYKDANDAAPVTSGNYVFYAKYRGKPGKRRASLHQVQAGVVADSPESFEVSQQLDNYLKGKPVQIVCMTTPNTVLLRTDETRLGCYTYTYLDTAAGSERLFDSWSRWAWHGSVGDMIGLSSYGSFVLMYTIKHDGANIWLACEQFSLESGLSDLPYADSLRPYSVASAGGFLRPGYADIVFAFEAGSERQFVGTTGAGLPDLLAAYPALTGQLWAGFSQSDAYVTPTNPYIRDRQGTVVLAGRLTLTSLSVSLADTGGMIVSVDTRAGTTQAADFSGRVLGELSATIGTQPIVTTAVSAWIGKEVRECKYTLRAKTWLPLTITAINWTGQSFNNTRQA